VDGQHDWLIDRSRGWLVGACGWNRLVKWSWKDWDERESTGVWISWSTGFKTQREAVRSVCVS